MRDRLVRWHKTYGPKGLVIIEVDGGRYEKLNIVRRDVKKKGVKHFVLWDKNCQNTEKYGITAWPVAYLIGPDGKVVWNGNPSRVINRSRALKQLLGRMNDLLAKQAKSQQKAAKKTKARKLVASPNK